MKIAKGVFSQNKVVIALFLVLIAAVSGFAQVNQDEMRDLPPVVFINYVGTHTRLDTREEIRQIGVGLGRQIANSERAGANNRYFVIHNVSDQETNKLNADIFGLGVDAGVDHIRNLRVILQGYLQQAYNYSANDALLLAEFITIYNAVYRGNWDFFASRYKTPVINNLIRDRAGLSIRYDEWPGRTHMLIPLGQGIGAIDTAAITDSRVIEEMRREDDQSVAQRQQMAELREREAALAEERARAERQQAQEEQRRIAQERAQTQTERQQVQADYQEGRITEEQARAAQEDLARREQELAKRAEAADQRERDANELERQAGQVFEQTQGMREQIASDQTSSLARQTAAAGIIGVTIENDKPIPTGSIVLLNAATGEELSRYNYDLIHSRTVTFVGGKLITIAGENKGNGAVRLIELNQSTLEIVNWGDNDINTGSLLWVNGNNLYAITINLRTNECFIGRFDTNIIMQARSAVKVHPQASIAIQQSGLLTQNTDGSALVLNPTDLTEIIKK